MNALSNNNKSGITNVRRVILDFAQSFFAEDEVYTWTENPATTKIEIVNEFATRTREIEKYPKIVLSRGDMHLRNISMNRTGANGTFLQPDTKHFQDLASGNLVLSVLSKQGVEAEQIAEQLWYALIAWRSELADSGYILKLEQISIGSMQPVKSDSDVRIMKVPIYISYSKEVNFWKTFDYYDVNMTVDSQRQWQSTDFYIFNDTAFFTDAPASGVDMSMTYLRRDTMEEVTESPAYSADGERKIFPFTHPVYGPYYITSGVDITILNSGLDVFVNKFKLYDDIQVTSEVGPVIYRIGHTYALPGAVQTFNSPTTYINPFFVSLTTGQSVKLTNVVYKLQSGGTATCHLLDKNGSIFTGYSGLLASTTLAETDPEDIILANNDEIRLFVADTDGSPENLTFNVFLEYIQ